MRICVSMAARSLRLVNIEALPGSNSFVFLGRKWWSIDNDNVTPPERQRLCGLCCLCH